MKKETKPKGWANLQQQLKEVREESFKQGVWKGQLDKEKEMFDKFEKMIDEIYLILKRNEDEKLNELPPEVAIGLQTGFLLGYADSLVKFMNNLKERLQKLKGAKK